MNSYFGSPFSPKGVPLLLWITMYWSAFIGGLILVALLLLPFGVELPGFSVDGKPVPPSQFFHDPVGVWFIPLGVVLAVLAYALFTRRPWSRTVMFSLTLALCFVTVIQVAIGTFAWTDAALTPLVPLVGWWYLYKSAGPTRYYEMLRSLRQSGAAV